MTGIGYNTMREMTARPEKAFAFGKSMEGHRVAAAHFRDAIRSYAPTRAELIANVGEHNPRSLANATSAVAAVKSQPSWREYSKRSVLHATLVNSVLRDCEMAFRHWEAQKTIISWMPADIQQLVREHTQP